MNWKNWQNEVSYIIVIINLISSNSIKKKIVFSFQLKKLNNQCPEQTQMKKPIIRVKM